MMSPPTIVMPSGRRSSEPVPVPKAKGKAPNSAAMVVMRTKAQHASLEDGVFCAHAVFAFGLQSKIDHHDGVFLDDADEQDDADDGNDVEVHFEEHESENGADAGGGQRGNDGERVNEAFVQNAKNNVNREKRGEDEILFVA
jgi:hypothetical protein